MADELTHPRPDGTYELTDAQDASLNWGAAQGGDTTGDARALFGALTQAQYNYLVALAAYIKTLEP